MRHRELHRFLRHVRSPEIKLLFAPLEAGSLIVQNSGKLRDTFHFSSSYLSAESDSLMMNFLEYGLNCREDLRHSRFGVRFKHLEFMPLGAQRNGCWKFPSIWRHG
jgi:hypothetical protein